MMQLEQHAETTARVSIPSRSTCIDRQRRTFHSTACTRRVCAWQAKWFGRVVGPLLAQMLHGLIGECLELWKTNLAHYRYDTG